MTPSNLQALQPQPSTFPAALGKSFKAPLSDRPQKTKYNKSGVADLASKSVKNSYLPLSQRRN